MAVLVRHRSPELSLAQYDEISPPIVEKLKLQPGFVLHVAFEDSQGFCVAEIWESQEDATQFFAKYIHPNLPEGIKPKRTLLELHSLVKAE